MGPGHVHGQRPSVAGSVDLSGLDKAARRLCRLAVGGVHWKLYRLLRRLLPKRHLPYPTRAGRVYLNLAESPMMLDRVLRRYERDKHRALAQLLSQGMTFIDVGANKGDFALFAARRVGPSGHVVAVEPAPENCRWLRRSVARNRQTNVTVVECAASEREGSAVLHLAPISGWHSLLPFANARGTVVVPTRTVDQMVGDCGLRGVDVVKIDVEGAEALVLRGAERTLEDNRNIAVLIDLHPHRGAEVEEVAGLLGEHGLHTFSVDDPSHEVSVFETSEVLARRRA
jgi:FkbM family methyltransferase